MAAMRAPPPHPSEATSAGLWGSADEAGTSVSSSDADTTSVIERDFDVGDHRLRPAARMALATGERRTSSSHQVIRARLVAETASVS